MNRKVKEHKIPKAFLIAVVFAVIFWSLIKLSKEYRTVISFPIGYVNLPQDKLIQKHPLKAINIQVRGTGFWLIKQRIRKSKIDLDTRNLQKKENSEYFFLIHNQRASIQNQLSDNYTVEAILQDSVFLNLGLLISKKIPVVANFNLEYKLGYHLLEKLKFSPDSVLVFGPEAQINKLKKIELEKLILKNISKNISKNVAIKKSVLFDKIKYTSEKVLVSGDVDRFTEGTLELPFEIINLPDSISVSTFPKKIRAVYQVGLSNFNKINENSFKITCDYLESKLNNLTYLIPKFSSKPDFVTSVKLIPSKVEFLIQK